MLYATQAPTHPLRCGAPLAPGYVFSYPAPARADCTQPVVVLQTASKPAALQPLGAAAVATKWGPAKNSRIALKAPSMDTARSWASTLARGGSNAEIVCEMPTWPASK